MAKSNTTFMVLILGAFALAGVIVLATCATQRRSGAAPERTEGPVKAAAKDESKPDGTTATPKLDEQLKAILSELASTFERHQAGSAKVKTVLAVAAQGVGATRGEGTYEFKMQGVKRLIRVFLSNSLNLVAEDKTYITAEIIDDMFDGEYLYKQLQQHRLKQITKKSYSPSLILQIGGHDLIDPLIDGHQLKFAGEEVVGGSPAYVIEAIRVGGSGKSKHYFDKSTGIRVKLEEFDEDGKLKVDIELSEINLAPEFSEDNFKARILPGFKLIDETVPQGPQP